MDVLAALPFLRPAWLLAVPLLLALWWWTRHREQGEQPGQGIIAPHLLRHLQVNGSGRRRIRPPDLAIVGALLCTVAAAGPAWRPAPSPFFSETAPVVVALEVSTTMLARDVAPDRLQRARHKVLDLLERRTGARTGLVAYAGSAHMVMPLTDDPGVIASFLEGLDPEVMPLAGDAPEGVLPIAGEMLAAEAQRGTVLLVTDGVPAASIAAFMEYASADGPEVVALVVGTEAGGPVRLAGGGLAADAAGRPLRAAVDTELLDLLEDEAGVAVVRSTVDGADIDRLLRALRSSLARAAPDADLELEDEGRLFLIPAVLLALAWFRRGFTAQWVVMIALAGALGAAPRHADARSFADLWFTPDQQGRWALEHDDAAVAAERFRDPMWRGVAAYRAGRFQAAAEAFAAVGSADGEFNLGNAQVRMREYRKALAAYERALELEADHAAARRNRDLVVAIIDTVESAREQSDTGGKLGADEVRFDNESDRGERAEVDAATQLDVGSAEQWMRQVETRTRDFLRTRFAIDLQRREAR